MAAVWSIEIRIQFATCLLALTYIPTWIMSPFTICLQVPPRYSNSWLSMFWDQLQGCTCIYTSFLILANLSSTIVSVARVLRVAFWRSKIALAHLMVGSGGEVVSLTPQLSKTATAIVLILVGHLLTPTQPIDGDRPTVCTKWRLDLELNVEIPWQSEPHPRSAYHSSTHKFSCRPGFISYLNRLIEQSHRHNTNMARREHFRRWLSFCLFFSSAIFCLLTKYSHLPRLPIIIIELFEKNISRKLLKWSCICNI